MGGAHEYIQLISNKNMKEDLELPIGIDKFDRQTVAFIVIGFIMIYRIQNKFQRSFFI